ncbi:Uncharacterised protein [Alistipes sp. cv1]|nr:Uncharacterised protein [Faecalibacterium prausnitzii]
MKKEQDQSVNIFTGKWKVVSLYCFVQEQGWTLFKRYGHNSFFWEFEEVRKLEFPTGTVAYEGRLKEHFIHSPKEETEYAYYPSDRQLYIDRSDYEPDGFCNICINDRYRAEHIRKNEYWLYDLEDVEKEPEDYRYRIKIRQV